MRTTSPHDIRALVTEDDSAVARKERTLAQRVRLEIPTDFARLLAGAPEEAKSWHAAVRNDFRWALDNGYVVAGLRRDFETSRSFYILEMRR